MKGGDTQIRGTWTTFTPHKCRASLPDHFGLPTVSLERSGQRQARLPETALPVGLKKDSVLSSGCIALILLTPLLENYMRQHR